MRICFVIGSLERGGAERQLINLATGLANHNHEVHIVSLKSIHKNNPLAQTKNVSYHSLSADDPLRLITGLFKLTQFMFTCKPDVVHGYLPMSNVILALLRPFMPKFKLVWGVRDSLGTWKGYSFHTKMFARMERWLSRIPHLIIVNSRAGLVNLMYKEYRAPIEIVRNGIDTEVFTPKLPRKKSTFRKDLGLSAKDILVGMVTRVKPIKDIETFIAAAAIAYGHNPKLRFVLVGDGDEDYLRALRTKVHASGLSDLFFFCPGTEDPAAIYRELNIHVLTSVAEGFPNTLCEAMACGTPCVSSRAGDAEKIISTHGELFPVSSVTEAAESIRCLVKRLSTDEKKLRADCRKHIVSNFSLKQLAEKTENVLQRILQR